MKKVDQLVNAAIPQPAQAVQTAERASVRRKTGADNNGRDHVDAINQLFAEFELAYHNQFHKAYAQEGSLNLAKKYWMNCLAEFSPEVIVRAGRQVVMGQQYLPTIAAMTAACENALSLFGLPPAHAAYHEACCAPEPKAQHTWSHPAVYLAGQQTGWFALASEPQAAIFPAFEYNYQQLCQRVVRGEKLDVAIPKALPESVPQPLSVEENKRRLQELRKRFDL